MTSLLENLSLERLEEVVTAANSGICHDDPSVMNIRRGFVDDENQLARWMDHDRAPQPRYDRRFGQEMLKRVKLKRIAGGNDE